MLLRPIPMLLVYDAVKASPNPCFSLFPFLAIHLPFLLNYMSKLHCLFSFDPSASFFYLEWTPVSTGSCVLVKQIVSFKELFWIFIKGG